MAPSPTGCCDRPPQGYFGVWQGMSPYRACRLVGFPECCQDEPLLGAEQTLPPQERCPPCVDDFLYICDDAYKREELIAMEMSILSTLKFDINIPIPYRFLRRFAKVSAAGGGGLVPRCL